MTFSKLLKILITFIILISVSYSVNSSEINSAFDRAIKTNQLDSGLIGIKIINLSNGKTIYSKNANKNFIPASNTKLVTGAATLLFLGKDFRYQTKLYYDKIQNHTINNLYIVFSGDPSFTTKDLQKLLNSLKTLKITKINHIYFVNKFFTGRNTSINESQSSTIFAYGAPSSIYNLNENSVALELTPEKQTFNIKQVSGEPLPFKNQLFIANKKQLKICQFNGYNYDKTLILSGCLPKNTYTFSFAVQNPKLTMKEAVLRELSKLNINMTNTIKIITNLPSNTTLLAEHNSNKLDVLLKHMLTISDNLYAQTILRTIGYYYNGVGSIISGKNAVFEILQNKLKLNTESIQLEDGAGGSENNLLSPNFLVSVLHKMSLNKNYKVFKSMLPIYGKTGTLKNFKGDKLKGNIFAKTGTQTTAIALSGYLIKGDNQYAFSILINSLKESQKSQAHNLERELLESLYKL
ncbi:MULTISPECIES: D-alanyl-D-alanine carboxypeptidase/D-alanyl-D-alanine endopeptidase [unclassified Francisella]|uniref:D-alanyl-D-alanine carboxypeptidase/D-alanyl-D-alanine endopeptidase n=1 Tax=unclassified Francisella TaxID=2610885 RepID=UPI002E3578E0|nr:MULTISPECIES: D-alanyl-D-alanine carboxypeptidase/D-alanyl-D-alanine-endopeptidase [unclassified Francisella]MED7818403.1 D-alanyl-D-alanine carboxypeptidase/D-alanyl-D-alanine-endopeptidase [Francisella sp. 19S2-4]MED7829239.1 D-alanyl-D-alanine carboxypeptidase/D-alanyl-D-alanine-endopeptidase [Francisella sp. 19S2-10]